MPAPCRKAWQICAVLAWLLLAIGSADAIDLRLWVGTWRVTATSNTGYTNTRIMHLRYISGRIVSDDGPLAAYGNQLKWQVNARGGGYSTNVYTLVSPGRATVQGGVYNPLSGSVMWKGTAVRIGN